MKKVAIIPEQDYEEVVKDLNESESNIIKLMHLDKNLDNYNDRVDISIEILFKKIRNITNLLVYKDK
jgi:hypothetical protein